MDRLLLQPQHQQPHQADKPGGVWDDSQANRLHETLANQIKTKKKKKTNIMKLVHVMFVSVHGVI